MKARVKQPTKLTRYLRVEAEQYLKATAVFVVTDAMTAKGVTQKDLAKRLKVTQGRVSQLLSGDDNMTLETLAHIAFALDVRPIIRFVDHRCVGGLPAIDVLMPKSKPEKFKVKCGACNGKGEYPRYDGVGGKWMESCGRCNATGEVEARL